MSLKITLNYIHPKYSGVLQKHNTDKYTLNSPQANYLSFSNWKLEHYSKIEVLLYHVLYMGALQLPLEDTTLQDV